jgi:Leucine-rich repeat (LRR) protein
VLCSADSAWEGGHRSPGSLLTTADLSHNAINRLRELSDHRFLEQLILHHNRISVIEGLSGLRFLQVSSIRWLLLVVPQLQVQIL